MQNGVTARDVAEGSEKIAGFGVSVRSPFMISRITGIMTPTLRTVLTTSPAIECVSSGADARAGEMPFVPDPFRPLT